MKTRSILILCTAFLVSMPSADAQSFKEGLKSIGDKIGKQIVKTAQSVKKQTTSSKTFDRDKALQKQWNFLFVRKLSACKKTCIHLEEDRQNHRVQGLLGRNLHVVKVIFLLVFFEAFIYFRDVSYVSKQWINSHRTTSIGSCLNSSHVILVKVSFIRPSGKS